MAKTIELNGKELKLVLNLTKIEQIEMQLGVSVFGELAKSSVPQMRLIHALFVQAIQTQSNEGLNATKAESTFQEAFKEGKFMEIMTVTMEALMEDMGFMFQTA